MRETWRPQTTESRTCGFRHGRNPFWAVFKLPGVENNVVRIPFHKRFSFTRFLLLEEGWLYLFNLTMPKLLSYPLKRPIKRFYSVEGLFSYKYRAFNLSNNYRLPRSNLTLIVNLEASIWKSTNTILSKLIQPSKSLNSVSLIEHTLKHGCVYLPLCPQSGFWAACFTIIN